MNDLILFPQQGKLIYDLISDAKESLCISTQALPDFKFCDAILNVRNNGVNIQILLTDPRYFRLHSIKEICDKHNLPPEVVSYSHESLPRSEKKIFYLTQNGVYPHYVNHDKVFLNHSKYMIIDNKISFIGSGSTAREDRTDVGLLSNDNTVIQELKNLFIADYRNKKYTPSNNTFIFVAPYNMREKIENLIKYAKRSIHLMFPKISDDLALFNLLIQKIEEGISVHVLLSPYSFGYNNQSTIERFHNHKLMKKGAICHMVYAPVIHNKTIIIDHEDPQNAELLISSANLSTAALDHSREVAIKTCCYQAVKQMMNFFSCSWEEAVAYS